MEMTIDGRAVRVEIGDCRAGWCDVFEIGPTLTGRMARLARYQVPEDLLTGGGAVHTGGHIYSVPRT
jgi:hypothetical protein